MILLVEGKLRVGLVRTLVGMVVHGLGHFNPPRTVKVGT